MSKNKGVTWVLLDAKSGDVVCERCKRRMPMPLPITHLPLQGQRLADPRPGPRAGPVRRHGVGIEISEAYAKQAIRRLRYGTRGAVAIERGQHELQEAML